MLNNLSFLTIHSASCEPTEEFTEVTESLNLQATAICRYVLNTHICNSEENLEQFYRGKKGNTLKECSCVSKYTSSSGNNGRSRNDIYSLNRSELGSLIFTNFWSYRLPLCMSTCQYFGFASETRHFHITNLSQVEG